MLKNPEAMNGTIRQRTGVGSSPSYAIHCAQLAIGVGAARRRACRIRRLIAALLVTDLAAIAAMSNAQTTSQAAPTRLGGYAGAISTIVLLCGGTGALLYYGAKSNHQEHERRAQQRRVAAIDAIKDDPATQTIVHDAELVAMIVNDSVAVERATALVFSDVDFSDTRFQRIAELVNLQDLGVYSCQDIDALFSYIQGMPSIQKIYIETSDFSAESVRLMATLPNLEQVRFEQEMSDVEVEFLKATLPNVKLGLPSPNSADSR